MTAKELLKIRQANAARARTALKRKRQEAAQAPVAPILTPSEKEVDWAVGIKNQSFAVMIDGKVVFAHDFHAPQEV